MSETLIGFLGILALFFLLLARMPVGMALLAVGFGGIWFIDGQRVAVLLVAEPELSLEVRAPQSIGCLGIAERRSLCLIAPLPSPANQTVAVQYRVNGADRGRVDHRK